jgi:predicted nucleic acid-binding protein
VVLVDTSIWIRFLAGREPYASTLDRLLASGRVMAHDLIQGEILIGDAGGRTEFLSAYAEVHRAGTVPHTEVVEFVRARKLQGRGIGWIDAHLLASTLVERCRLWTADASLATIAAELRIAHIPSR